eukprot:TRINITY_DN2778_c0_g1_i1.p1 TRINITY_DN2778_c0_g1~~TRINITY_DN2778_c0_g1_i1.p1  ORF type:complete len:847 (-),score=168.95 TRINITY_DN2778_c0_g1_i1:242-2782(-)
MRAAKPVAILLACVACAAFASLIELRPQETSGLNGLNTADAIEKLSAAWIRKLDPVELDSNFSGWFKFRLPEGVSAADVNSFTVKASIRTAGQRGKIRWSLERYPAGRLVIGTHKFSTSSWEEFSSKEVRAAPNFVDENGNILLRLSINGANTPVKLASLSLSVKQGASAALRDRHAKQVAAQRNVFADSGSVLMNMLREVNATTECVPKCEGRECGYDGCSGWCGANNCGMGRGCNAKGVCVPNLGICGDGYCGEGERCETCALDCPCVVNCGNGLCESGESTSTCPGDCPRDDGVCGDGKCESNQWAVEDAFRCCRDCGGCDVCGDGVCGQSEGCFDCPSDCGACAATCGDGQCNGAETCSSCSRDCGYCAAAAGNGVCDYPAERCDTHPAECGACQEITMTVEYKGVTYAVSDNTDPASSLTQDDSCPSTPAHVPRGWMLAKWTADAQEMIATGRYPFNTNCLVFADGRAVNSMTGAWCTDFEVYINKTRGFVNLFPALCGSKILLQRGSMSCPDDCSGDHGMCDETTGVCVCNDRWTGYNCGRQIGDVSVPDLTHNTWWKPTVRTRWQWQLQDPIDMSYDVPVYDIDFGYPASVIDQLHQQGRKVICYWSAGSAETWRADYDMFPADVKGGALVFGVGDVFNDEQWLDIRRLDVIGPLMLDRIDHSKMIGCDAVEYDNPDGFYHDAGFAKPFTYEQQLYFNRWLAGQAHARNMSAILKNDIMQVWELRDTFDGAVNEQCWEDEECYMWWTMLDIGKPLFQTEYEVERCYYCERANQMGTSTIKKHPDLTACRMDCSTPWNQTHCDMYRTTGDKCWVRQCEPANECPTDATQDPICGSTTLAC